MRANKMNPVWSGVFNTWKFNYKGKSICKILLPNPKIHAGPDYSWVITPNHDHLSEYAESITSEGLQKLILDHINYCNNCSRGKCNPMGRDITVFGKDYKSLCYWRPIFVHFNDPDETTVGIIKRLLELERKARDEEAQSEK